MGAARATELLLSGLHAGRTVDWSEAVIDSSYMRGLKGARKGLRAGSGVPDPARSTV